ncbi:MAG: orotidine-5'-phosphate decarboxylase [Candidatus Gastranaerophilales bacterium]|nr:orotidine-5'-phosphate decarboxylase [Candidatus Gastranaerophilales bacterium]
MITINKKIKEKIVLALDVDSLEDAKRLITELKDFVGVFKVGLQLYTQNGNEIIDFMTEQGLEFFLDVKLLDIPNTVAKASENIVKRGASFFNIHTLGGAEMMRQCVKSAKETAIALNGKEPTILGVTVLTSISDEVLNNELGIEQKSDDYVLRLARLAKDSGLDGVVASVWEAKRIKEVCGDDFKVLCPGIRPEWSLKNDQQRAATPKFAITEGADYLVIGRAVTSADDRVKAMEKIYSEIGDMEG